MIKYIKDFIPEQDIKYLKKFGINKITNILDSNDDNAKLYLIEVLSENTSIIGSYLKEHYCNDKGSNVKYNIDLIETSKNYYQGRYNPNLYDHVTDLPNCFIDYIKELK